MWFLKLTIVFTTGLSSVQIAAAVPATFVSGPSPLLLCVVGYNCVYCGYRNVKTLHWDNSTVFEWIVCFDEQGGGEFLGIN